MQKLAIWREILAIMVQNLVQKQPLGEELRRYFSTPIIRQSNTGGYLLVSSTQSDHFSPTQQQLIQRYANPLTLILDSPAFFESEYVHPGLLHTQALQRTYLVEFQHRLIETMLQATKNQQPLTIVQAQQLVWQQLKDNLLHLTRNCALEPDNHLSHKKELSHDL